MTPGPPGARDRARSFGARAELYDRARPGYPSEAIDAVLGTTRPLRVLEVGAGSGLATASLLRPGVAVTAIEPSPELAAICARRVAAAGAGAGSRVLVGEFEAVAPDLADASFDVVCAAQSWHWVDPRTGTTEAARLLVDGGRLCGLWNHPVAIEPAIGDEIRAAYEAHAPDLAGDSMFASFSWSSPGLLGGHRAEFEPEVFAEVPWTTRYSTTAYCDLLRTHSDHALLAPDRLKALLGALASVIDSIGGSFVVHYGCEVATARRIGGRLDQPTAST